MDSENVFTSGNNMNLMVFSILGFKYSYHGYRILMYKTVIND